MNNPALNKLIGEKVEERRLEIGMTHEQLELELGLRPRVISKIVRGFIPISLTLLVNMSIILGVRSDQLLGLAPEGERSNANEIINVLARQSASRLALAERYAAIELEGARLLDIASDMIGSAEDIIFAVERIGAKNPNKFRDLVAGSLLVSAANELKKATAAAKFKL